MDSAVSPATALRRSTQSVLVIATLLLDGVPPACEAGSPGLLERVLLLGVLRLRGLLGLRGRLLVGLLLRAPALDGAHRRAGRGAFTGVEVVLVARAVVVVGDRTDGGSLRGSAGRA